MINCIITRLLSLITVLFFGLLVPNLISTTSANTCSSVNVQGNILVRDRNTANVSLPYSVNETTSTYRSETNHAVTAREYCEFLNAVAASNCHHLYDEKMEYNLGISCIQSVSSSDAYDAHSSYYYDVTTGKENIPIVFTSCLDAIRYCNWLENNKPVGENFFDSTEHGTYELQDDQIIAMNSRATFIVLPSKKTSEEFSIYLSSGSNSFQSDGLLQSNHTGFHIMRTLVATDSVQKTSKSGSKKTFWQSLVAGLTVASYMFGVEPVEVTLNDFRDAAKDHPQATRLIIKEDELGHPSIVPEEALPAYSGSNRDENLAIIKALRTALESEHPAETVQQLLDYQTTLMKFDFPLTAQELNNVISKFDDISTRTRLGQIDNKKQLDSTSTSKKIKGFSDIKEQSFSLSEHEYSNRLGVSSKKSEESIFAKLHQICASYSPAFITPFNNFIQSFFSQQQKNEQNINVTLRQLKNDENHSTPLSIIIEENKDSSGVIISQKTMMGNQLLITLKEETPEAFVEKLAKLNPPLKNATLEKLTPNMPIYLLYLPLPSKSDTNLELDWTNNWLQIIRKHFPYANPEENFIYSDSDLDNLEKTFICSDSDLEPLKELSNLSVLDNLVLNDSKNNVISKSNVSNQQNTTQPSEAQPIENTFKIHSKQWNLLGDRGIHAREAWKICYDASDVQIGVIDTGVHYTHQDLASISRITQGHHFYIKNNTKMEDNDITDDNAPFYNLDGKLRYPGGHGTHVTGIIGATGSVLVSGVVPKSNIVNYKVIERNNADFFRSMYHACDNGIEILNCSFGPWSYYLKDFLSYAQKKGVIVVIAAGNDTENLNPTNPYAFVEASYKQLFDNVIVVASSQENNDDVASRSNTGAISVQIAAPGDKIFSTYNDPDETFWGKMIRKSPKNQTYTTLSGTSMAAPHVTGALALMKAHFKGKDYQWLIDKLLDSADKIKDLAGKVAGGAGYGRRLNLVTALTSDSNTIPGQLRDLKQLHRDGKRLGSAEQLDQQNTKTLFLQVAYDIKNNKLLLEQVKPKNNPWSFKNILWKGVGLASCYLWKGAAFVVCPFTLHELYSAGSWHEKRVQPWCKTLDNHSDLFYGSTCTIAPWIGCQNLTVETPKGALKYCMAADQEARSVKFFTKAAKAKAAEKTSEGNSWNNAGDASKNAAQNLKNAIKAEASGKPDSPAVAAKYREAAKQQALSAEHYVKAAIAYAASKVDEGASWNEAADKLEKAAKAYSEGNKTNGDWLAKEAKAIEDSIYKNQSLVSDKEEAKKAAHVARESLTKAEAEAIHPENKESDAAWEEALEHAKQAMKAWEKTVTAIAKALEFPEKNSFEPTWKQDLQYSKNEKNCWDARVTWREANKLQDTTIAAEKKADALQEGAESKVRAWEEALDIAMQADKKMQDVVIAYATNRDQALPEYKPDWSEDLGKATIQKQQYSDSKKEIAKKKEISESRYATIRLIQDKATKATKRARRVEALKTGDSAVYQNNIVYSLDKAATYWSKAAEAYMVGKAALLEQYTVIAEKYQMAEESYSKAARAYASKKTSEGGLWLNAGNGFYNGADKLAKAIEAEDADKPEVVLKYREAAEQQIRSANLYTKATTAYATGTASEGNSWLNAGNGCHYAAGKLEKAIDAEAADKLEVALKYREAAKQQIRSVDLYTQAATAYAAGKANEGACWLNAGNGFYNGADKLEKAIEAEASRKPNSAEVAAKYRAVAGKNEQSAGKYQQAAQAHSKGTWFTGAKALEGEGLALRNEADELARKVESLTN